MTVAGRARYRMLGTIAIVGAVLCIAALVVLTMLLPDPYPSSGGFVPIPTPAGR